MLIAAELLPPRWSTVPPAYRYIDHHLLSAIKISWLVPLSSLQALSPVPVHAHYQRFSNTSPHQRLAVPIENGPICRSILLLEKRKRKQPVFRFNNKLTTGTGRRRRRCRRGQREHRRSSWLRLEEERGVVAKSRQKQARRREDW